MKVGSTHAILVEENGEQSLNTVDTIEYQGKTWFVPEWLDNPEEGWSTPARLVRVLHGVTVMPSQPGHKAQTSYPIPRCVFEGRIPTQSKDKFDVVENPGIRLHGPKGIH